MIIQLCFSLTLVSQIAVIYYGIDLELHFQIAASKHVTCTKEQDKGVGI